MRARKGVLCLFLLLMYGFCFFQQEQFAKKTQYNLAFPLPSAVQKAVLGYLSQLGGEMHFIRTAVFLGGTDSNNLSATHANSLSKNFEVMSNLHPPFIDTYFLCQATLPYFGVEKAAETNLILKKGTAALPDNWTLSFFMGFNYFYFLEDNAQAADVLMHTSKLPNAPNWLGHLASILKASGGDIYAGLIWLRAMRSAEEDEASIARYDNDIAMFEQALSVEKAISAFRKKYSREPSDLSLLVPEFLTELPDFGDNFVLVWKPPILNLKRPPQPNM